MAINRFKKKLYTPSLPLDKLMGLKKVFESHSWEVDENRSNSRFLKYIKLLEFLKNEEEQDLILELTKRFKHIKDNDYLINIGVAVEQLINDFPDITTFYVIPALAKKDWGCSGKSSQSVQYKFKGDELEELIELDGVNFRAIEKIERFLEKKPKGLNRTEKILFVDDFIGSGDTALEAIDMLSDVLKVNNNIIFLSIVVHEMGKNRIIENGYNIYYSELINRGLTDFYNNNELSTKISIMEQIESKIPRLSKEYSFGYKQCEALVSMHRIPNNSFPIYWFHKNVSPYNRG